MFHFEIRRANENDVSRLLSLAEELMHEPQRMRSVYPF